MKIDLNEIGYKDLKAPVFFAWHMTNKCNFSCIHCLWESGPDGGWPDELDEDEAMDVCRQIVELDIPYVALSGGEPLLCPWFWKACEFLSQHGVDIKIESNGYLIDGEIARRLSSLNLRSIQISIDGATQETYSKMRPGKELSRAIRAVVELIRHGVNTEVVYVPAKFNKHEAGMLIDMAAQLGVKGFYTGKTMYVGRAVKNWDIIGLSKEENEELMHRIERRAQEYKNKMNILFYPYDVVEELRYRLEHPAASLLLMANGKVKLIGSMPFVCGDIRKQSLSEIWRRYIKAWGHPEVIKYVKEVLEDPSQIKRANQFIELDL